MSRMTRAARRRRRKTRATPTPTPRMSHKPCVRVCVCVYISGRVMLRGGCLLRDLSVLQHQVVQGCEKGRALQHHAEGAKHLPGLIGAREEGVMRHI